MQLKKCSYLLLIPGSPTVSLDSDGWIVIQRRVDASVSFERCWNEYVAGFGEVDGNFWLGLDTMHALTTAQPMRLQIDVVPYNIPPLSIMYQRFIVSDASSFYRLSISGYSCTSPDATETFHNHDGSMFSTYDQDHDPHALHCAQTYGGGGWWYSGCFFMNLNGIYEGATASDRSIRVKQISAEQYEPIARVTMKIRPDLGE